MNVLIFIGGFTLVWMTTHNWLAMLGAFLASRSLYFLLMFKKTESK